MRWLVFAALVLACKGKREAPKRDDAPVQPRDAAVPDAAIDAPPPDAGMATTITSNGVGPIVAKMIEEEDYAKALVGLRVTSKHQEGEDFIYDEIIARKGKTQVLRAVITDRSLFKVEVYDPMFATAAGVTVGMTVGDAAARTKDLKCAYETYDPEADAERVDRALRCESASLRRVMFEIDHESFEGPEGSVSPKSIAERKIVEIVWLAPHD